jgi:hypothetical protein
MLNVKLYEALAINTRKPVINLDMSAPLENLARISLADVAEGEWYWMAAVVHQLSSDENGGNHHVYLIALDEQGRRDESVWIEWGWEGKRPDEAAPTFRLSGKPAHEPAGNIDLHWGQRVKVKVYGELSDRVENLNIMLPRTGPQAYQGHHSTLVVFARKRKSGQVEPPEEEPGEGPGDSEARELLRKIYGEIEAFLNAA